MSKMPTDSENCDAFLRACRGFIAEIESIDSGVVLDPSAPDSQRWIISMRNAESKVRGYILDAKQNHPSKSQEVVATAEVVKPVTAVLSSSVSEAKVAAEHGLNVWNGRCWLCYSAELHVYAAAKTLAELERMLNSIQGEYACWGNMGNEVRTYWHKGCWGNDAREAGISPTESGVWIYNRTTKEMIQVAKITPEQRLAEKEARKSKAKTRREEDQKASSDQTSGWVDVIRK